MRLDKFISYALDISREDARKLIKNKEIHVNDNLINNPASDIDENKDKIKKGLAVLRYDKYIYLMVNKPSGYLSATIDKDKTVIDLIDKYKKYNLAIAGRLDIDSVGLLLLTNDGELIHALTSPKSNIYKKYYVEVEGVFKEEAALLFEKGIEIFDEKKKLYTTLPAVFEMITADSAHISIKEGKYHQVKKMCKKIGNKVKYLKRIKIGDLCLDENLKEGEFRNLSNQEIDLLKSLTKTRQ